jgi:predicted aldo/keto reductase-like oxidoreductase
MNYRRLGRTSIQVSVIGIGTCQLRLVSERQAIETLRRGFELGVNLVHTEPDYEGADDLIVQALKETPRDVVVCSQSSGPMSQFERHFEDLCAKLGKPRVELFGIACIEDGEATGDNVWGTGGQVEFLLRKKEEGRLGGVFCSTHGSPEYIKRLIETNVFDALLIAYNMLGFHLLSESLPPLGSNPGHDTNVRKILRLRGEIGFESLARNKTEVFPLAQERDIGLMIMKPLAGGLLCEGKAFPPRVRLTPELPRVTATEALRFILRSPEVACVVPGTASPAEAEENALAGYGSLALGEEDVSRLASAARAFEANLCSRCGHCTTTCSQGLWVPWLFRAGYISLFPGETFETPVELEYFRLHPGEEATCQSCPQVTCSCPAGLDIPGRLIQVHGHMLTLRQQGRVPPPEDRPSDEADATERAPGGAVPPLPGPGATALQRIGQALKHRLRSDDVLTAKVAIRDLPEVLRPGELAICRLYLENRGRYPWYVARSIRRPRTVLRVYLDGALQQTIPLRRSVEPAKRGHFCFELMAPQRAGVYQLRFDIVAEAWWFSRPRSLCLLQSQLVVQAPH